MLSIVPIRKQRLFSRDLQIAQGRCGALFGHDRTLHVLVIICVCNPAHCPLAACSSILPASAGLHICNAPLTIFLTFRSDARADCADFGLVCCASADIPSVTRQLSTVISIFRLRFVLYSRAISGARNSCCLCNRTVQHHISVSSTNWVFVASCFYCATPLNRSALLLENLDTVDQFVIVYFPFTCFLLVIHFALRALECT